MSQTFQQECAKFALEQVQTYANANCDHKKFKARASELPFMILSNGLGQALAFFKSQGNTDGYDYLYQILNAWLTRQNGGSFSGGHGSPDGALIGVTECTRDQYTVAQADALLLMEWVKKFANAFMVEGGTP